MTTIPTTTDSLAEDLANRTAEACEQIANLVLASGVTMTNDDVARLVIDKLPAGYPMPSGGRDELQAFICRIAGDLFSNPDEYFEEIQ